MAVNDYKNPSSPELYFPVKEGFCLSKQYAVAGFPIISDPFFNRFSLTVQRFRQTVHAQETRSGS